MDSAEFSGETVSSIARRSSTRRISRPGRLQSRKSSLVRKFRSLFGCVRSSDLSSLGHRDTDTARSMDSNIIPGSGSVQGQVDVSTEPLDSNMIEGGPLGLHDPPSTHPLCSDSIQSRPSSRRDYKHDVFLSFRGTDTRNNFTDHLYNNLIRKGIFAFKDDEKLEKGEPISSQLLQAIQDSRVSIIVFSKDYAGSTWCLEEMATIAECKRELGQIVFSIFYDVDASDVRKQTGAYENAFVLHTETFKQDLGKVDRWKRAMTDLANSVGWDIRDMPEFIEIDKIIQKVVKILDHKFSGSANDLVGIQPRVKELEKLLKLSLEVGDFRVLGVWGMGGIGKTTLATVLYDKISYKFDTCCFIEDVSKNYKDGGAIAVQRQILRQTLHEQNLDTYTPSEIAGIVRNRLSPINVLIVLDNVDEIEQLEKLAISPNLLGRGSRMIITTRNEHILKSYGVDAIYKVPLLNYDAARELLFRKAFKSQYGPRSSSCVEMTPEILEYAQNLPLAIKVVGSFLHNRDAFQWRDALKRLKKNPDKKITDVLQISFEGLQEEEKEIFLHIACFFRGEREEYVKRILNSCGLHPHIGIQVIMEKSLITISNQEINMHEMLQELGKKIVREKYPEEPALWSRLWLYNDFENVLISEKGTNHVKAIVLDQKNGVPECSQLRIEGLSKMRDLKLLILYHKNFFGSLNFLSHNLQYLLWDGYPFSSLPSFKPYSSLVELNLPNSNIKRLWEGRKNIPHLERVDLSNSKDLIETPNFEWSPSLKRLDLTGCTNLRHVHPSIGLLAKLAYLSLRGCVSLFRIDLGGTECKLSSLRVLHLSGCGKLKSMPDFTGLSNLEYLDLEQCKHLCTVHESIWALAMLKFLSLGGCVSLGNIPNVSNMASLQTLNLRYCINLRYLPREQIVMFSSCLESLIFLDLGFCGLREIPNSIGELRCLERLNLAGNDFSYVPNTINRLFRLAYLNLTNCRMLERLPELPFDSDSSGGRYFQTVSTSRNHRSGLYILNCIKLEKSCLMLAALSWLARLVQHPCHFRCGFDIVIPISSEFPEWYFNHQFEGGSIVRIVDSDVDDNWLGFAFCATFEQNKDFYGHFGPPYLHLSFENEHTEEYFDMTPCLYRTKVNLIETYGWIIYISRVHCHFVKTGARITFKAKPYYKVHKWGLRMVFKQDIEKMKRELHTVDNQEDSHPRFHSYRLVIEDAHECSSSSEPKIQLPYNWLVSEEEENEKMEAKNKEDNLSNVGLIDR